MIHFEHHLKLDHHQKKHLAESVSIPCAAYLGAALTMHEELVIFPEQFMRVKYQLMHLLDDFISKPFLDSASTVERIAFDLERLGISLGMLIDLQLFNMTMILSWISHYDSSNTMIWRQKLLNLFFVLQIRFCEARRLDMASSMENFFDQLYGDMLGEHSFVLAPLNKSSIPASKAENSLTVSRKITSKEFLKNTTISSDDIDELGELQEELSALLGSAENIPLSVFVRFGEMLEKISQMLSGIMDFGELGYAVLSLSRVLANAHSRSLENAVVYRMLEGASDDLYNWHKMIFVEQSALDIHYLDDSLLSSISQLEAKITGQSIGEELDLF